VNILLTSRSPGTVTVNIFMKIFVLNIRRIDYLTIYDRGDVFSNPNNERFGRSVRPLLFTTAHSNQEYGRYFAIRSLLHPTRNMVDALLYDLCETRSKPGTMLTLVLIPYWAPSTIEIATVILQDTLS
jgi:hypothetical protein